MEGDAHVIAGASTWPSAVGTRSLTAGSVNGRAILERRTIHSFGTPEEQLARFPGHGAARRGTWALATTPLIREGDVIGSMMIAP